MPNPFRASVTVLLACTASITTALALVPAAQARDAFFTAAVQAQETVKSTVTSTEPDNCYPPFAVTTTASQTVSLRTTRAQPVSAHIIDAGSSRGLVELAPSGSGYAKIPGVVGTIERHADETSSQCPGAPVPAQDCGVRSSKQWGLVLQPTSVRRHRQTVLQGLGVYWSNNPMDAFKKCPAPESPQPQILDVAAIDAGSLFDKRRRVIVVHITGTIPWHFDDKVSRTVTDGTYSRSITLTLRRTR